VNSLTSQRYTNRNLYTKLLKEIEKAKKVVIVATPFIDKDSVDKLMELAARGIKVYIITLADPRRTAKILQYIVKRQAEVENVWCYTLSKIHAKIYIVDLEKIITGSVNLVKSADKNIETLEIIKNSEQAISETIRLFSIMLREAKTCKEFIKV
jgi:phosphatidylserine/phosphatidylglycerophosphate/cardiolipin synthase-like enzyme